MRQVILASGSPRRQELLQKMGIPFTAIPSDSDEQLDEARHPAEVACELGLGKAKAVADRYPQAIVIGSDTIVHVGDRQLGKQTTVEAEREQLRLLSGQRTYVTTSVAIVCRATHFAEVQSDTATVVFKPYDEVIADQYIQTDDWRDKAVYGIQSGAAPMIDHMTGNYDTVLGLSTEILATLLAKFDVAATVVRPEPPVRVLLDGK
ncbi:MAG: Maf family nucleotide pyrophosphatase [Candidatus Saccharimonadales bacterium]